ncbi:hypothetical protein EI94DRAFT_958876 [Lactarius quietus]|nr:hypothetical protein EI94DRAFT_958876 [Lactarius quietus]
MVGRKILKKIKTSVEALKVSEATDLALQLVGVSEQRREIHPPWSPTQFQCPLPAASVDGFLSHPQDRILPLFPSPKQRFHLLLLDVPCTPFPSIFVPSPPPFSPQLRSFRSPFAVSWKTLLAFLDVFILFYLITPQPISLLLFFSHPKIRCFTLLINRHGYHPSPAEATCYPMIYDSRHSSSRPAC